jgi:hypothetical protein
MSWTPKEQETARAMWDTGKSALDISRALGTKTRNAVIGWLHRQGIGDKDRSVSYTMMQERRRRNKAELMALKRAAGRSMRTARATHKRSLETVDKLYKAANENGLVFDDYRRDLNGFHAAKRVNRHGEYIPGPEGINTLNVKRAECRWPMSMEPRQPRYVDDAPDMGEDALCGHVTAHASPYCQHHAGRAAKPKGGEA